MLIKFVKKCWRVIRGIFATTVVLGVTPSYLILHVGSQVVCLLLPRKFAYFIDDFLWGSYQKLVVLVFEYMTGTEIILSGEIPKKQENVVFICNHQCTVDWIVTDMVALRQGMISRLRYVFKDGIKYLPLYGYAFGMHSGVFVRRDGTYSATNMRRVLNKLNKSEVLSWFVVFPEGTRFSTKRKELLSKSQAFAIANDLKPLNQVLTPRVKAFHCALDGLSEHADAVYDVTIVYEEKSEPALPGNRYQAPNMWKFLISPSPRIYIRFDRIPISEVPTKPQRATLEWLHSRFERKDLLISHHFGLEVWEESADNVAGVVTASGVNGVMPSVETDALKLGKPSTISLFDMLPTALLLPGLTAMLMTTPTCRIAYLSMLFGGSLFTMAYSAIFF